MNDKTFTFDLVDKYTPEVVIENSLKQIEEATRGYVCGNIKVYEGPITSYTKRLGFAAALSEFQSTSETVEVDIQNDLGEQDREDHRYEVYLTVKGLEHYKYRMMFIDYGTISYPLLVVMNEELASEYSGKIQTSFSIDTMDALEKMMEKVINSNKLVSLLQSLINESIRKENTRAGIFEFGENQDSKGPKNNE